jgi:hypothetical protein
VAFRAEGKNEERSSPLDVEADILLAEADIPFNCCRPANREPCHFRLLWTHMKASASRCKERDMRPLAFRSFGEAPAIHDIPIHAADGAFLIRVRHAEDNPIDYKRKAMSCRI